jgi:hypothetical protein
VYYQRDASVVCFARPLTNPLPKPDFVNFTFVGEVLRISNLSFVLVSFLLSSGHH